MEDSPLLNPLPTLSLRGEEEGVPPSVLNTMSDGENTTTFFSKTPARLGFRMPAEWEPHDSTWLTWPRPDGISFPDKYDSVPPVYATLIRHLVQVEDVNINVWNAEMEATVRSILTKHKTPLERVHFHHFPAYEPWCRDHGPIFLVRERDGVRERAVVDWAYNAWGGKYQIGRAHV